MALAYDQGRAVDPHEVWEHSGSQAQEIAVYGNDMEALAMAARFYGFRTQFCEAMTVDFLESQLARRNLVILNIKAFPTGDATHAVLAVGFDKTEKRIYIQDPSGKQTSPASFTYAELEARWTAFLANPRRLSQHGGLIVFPH